MATTKPQDTPLAHTIKLAEAKVKRLTQAGPGAAMAAAAAQVHLNKLLQRQQAGEK